jgi:hypothetical protein
MNEQPYIPNFSRTHTGFIYPATFPLDQINLLAYTFLIHPNESLTGSELAERIRKYSDNPLVREEAYRLERWCEFITFAADRVQHFDALPTEFEFKDVVYGFEQSLNILGDDAIQLLVTMRPGQAA